ncbi:bifunctional riboflavin kinase/FAD synthetase [Methylobacterium persicinum]|uniref:Riboflavin biosynthesis protein n=1 Tax=Methylobacterium persicinum TaxID=374426 RepID=A0ABU0HRW7_9HYPH|nr:bifunctional riboflavin kinase/FAD synthetase [Methylobacterium persicinum]MDQ0444445.1 riboflavin kinase/FMN adenylyltransferase [Methylobacterium persicinum]GJE39527.1 Bifunctional riboflavin kinase/FMN adenylyltransferase [Methylobacterium persicinum]
MVPGDDTTARPFLLCRVDEPLPAALRGAVAAIGNFDGVHRGHRALAATVRAEAEAGGHPAVALTFAPHPRAFFRPHAPMFRLTGEQAKEILFAQTGLDGLIIRRFDAGLAGTGARAFVMDFLHDGLGLSGVVVGHDFHFGRAREGTPALLQDLCREAGMSCRLVEPVALPGEQEPVSSSKIRAALAEGDVTRANALLGYRWFVIATVRHGDKRGRTLGYPTANLMLDDCGLAHGIYAVRIRLPDGQIKDGVASYGRRPTFDDGAPLLEVNLFAFSGDLYGQDLAVEFVGYIRGEERFAGADELIARMHLDAAEARRLLAADTVPSMLA